MDAGFEMLRHIQRQSFAAEDVEMQVRHGLAGGLAGVLGITRMWVGAWGWMSRKAKTWSSS